MKEMTAVIFTSNKLCHGLIFKLERIFFGGQPITEVPMRFRPKRSKLLAVQNSIQGRKIGVVGKIPTIHKYEEYWMAKNCTVEVRTEPFNEHRSPKMCLVFWLCHSYAPCYLITSHLKGEDVKAEKKDKKKKDKAERMNGTFNISGIIKLLWSQILLVEKSFHRGQSTFKLEQTPMKIILLP